MRLFIAINFDDKVKGELIDTQSLLREYAVSGNFSRKENLHLTLVFLGEVLENRLPTLKQILENVNTPPFSLNIGGVGVFRRNNGDILWIGIDESASLTQLHIQLCEGLSKYGFEVEARKFTPHLTLARQVRLNRDFDNVNFSHKTHIANFTVNTISLMCSEYIDGKLTYTEIYQKQLRN